MAKLGEWIRDKYKSQAAFAELLGVTQSRVSKWLSGYEPIPDDFRKRIEGLKYKGPWPREEAQEAPTPAAGPYVTEAAFEAWRAYWREGEERLLKRLTTLEDQVQKLRQQAGLE